MYGAVLEDLTGTAVVGADDIRIVLTGGRAGLTRTPTKEPIGLSAGLAYVHTSGKSAGHWDFRRESETVPMAAIRTRGDTLAAPVELVIRGTRDIDLRDHWIVIQQHRRVLSSQDRQWHDATRPINSEADPFMRGVSSPNVAKARAHAIDNGGPQRIAELTIDSLTVALIREPGGNTHVMASTNMGVFELRGIDSTRIATWAETAVQLAPPVRNAARVGYPDSLMVSATALEGRSPADGYMRFARLTEGSAPDYQFVTSNGGWGHSTRLRFTDAIRLFTFLAEGPADSIGWRESRLPRNGEKNFSFWFDKPALPRENNPAPRYPPALRQANVEGEVLLQFLVDTTGRAVMSATKVLRSTDSQFTAAVGEVLPALRFYVAERDGRKVPMIVTQPFLFRLTR